MHACLIHSKHSGLCLSSCPRLWVATPCKNSQAADTPGYAMQEACWVSAKTEGNGHMLQARTCSFCLRASMATCFTSLKCWRAALSCIFFSQELVRMGFFTELAL